jgi:hypothetical protein
MSQVSSIPFNPSTTVSLQDFTYSTKIANFILSGAATTLKNLIQTIIYSKVDENAVSSAIDFTDDINLERADDKAILTYLVGCSTFYDKFKDLKEDQTWKGNEDFQAHLSFWQSIRAKLQQADNFNLEVLRKQLPELRSSVQEFLGLTESSASFVASSLIPNVSLSSSLSSTSSSLSLSTTQLPVSYASVFPTFLSSPLLPMSLAGSTVVASVLSPPLIRPPSANADMPLISSTSTTEKKQLLSSLDDFVSDLRTIFYGDQNEVEEEALLHNFYGQNKVLIKLILRNEIESMFKDNELDGIRQEIRYTRKIFTPLREILLYKDEVDLGHVPKRFKRIKENLHKEKRQWFALAAEEEKDDKKKEIKSGADLSEQKKTIKTKSFKELKQEAYQRSQRERKEREKEERKKVEQEQGQVVNVADADEKKEELEFDNESVSSESTEQTQEQESIVDSAEPKSRNSKRNKRRSERKKMKKKQMKQKTSNSTGEVVDEENAEIDSSEQNKSLKKESLTEVEESVEEEKLAKEKAEKEEPLTALALVVGQQVTAGVESKDKKNIVVEEEQSKSLAQAAPQFQRDSPQISAMMLHLLFLQRLSYSSNVIHPVSFFAPSFTNSQGALMLSGSGFFSSASRFSSVTEIKSDTKEDNDGWCVAKIEAVYEDAVQNLVLSFILVNTQQEAVIVNVQNLHSLSTTGILYSAVNDRKDTYLFSLPGAQPHSDALSLDYTASLSRQKVNQTLEYLRSVLQKSTWQIDIDDEDREKVIELLEAKIQERSSSGLRKA